MSKKSFLIILDGWGISSNNEVSAIAKAKTPFINSLLKKYPHNTLTTFGEQVGLPKGQMGNSEVGHLNIGAGRVVFQELLKISNACEDGTLAQNKVLLQALNQAKEQDKKVHFMGLVSDGGVHSHLNHLKKLTSIANENGLKKVFIHAFTDGRDTDPNAGIEYLTDVQNHINQYNYNIATICGRYYAMDRDKRWERVKKAYDLLLNGTGEQFDNHQSALQSMYDKNITDEFIEPIILDKNGLIEADDTVICFNFRTDRCREITEVLTQTDFPELGMKKKQLNYVTMTKYDQAFKGVKVIFEKDNLTQTLGEHLAKLGKTQLRAAETEKYPHVTFFFNGGREEPFEGEHRIMAASPKVATYDLQPEMSAAELTKKTVQFVQKNQPDFVCLNYANADMVGHTGDFDAAVKAVEFVDNCVEELIKSTKSLDYTYIIIADHGNSDKMKNEDGSPNTAHTVNPVPIIVVNERTTTVKEGKLADIAPTILSLMDLPKSDLMTGEILTK